MINFMDRRIFYIRAFLLFVAIQQISHVCLAETKTLQRYEFQLSGQNWQRRTMFTSFVDVKNASRKKPISNNKGIKSVVAVVDNRFIAHGIITDIKCAQKGIQKFSMQIKKTEPFKDYRNFGPGYLGKEVEVFSEIGIPSFFQVGVKVSVVLRVSGDEWGQYLFFVEEIDNESKN
ncbi:MAG: hypothetical protein E3K32_04120 [wastewater metagenome]|nr:hypothetical protein [Candidatus Loosdrechtia aerotolerans]